jgi:ABC-type glycerol-3-phosphate transport system substrate-binding protein
MMDIWENLRHEIASLAVGALVSWIGNKARRLAQDVNAYWQRMRAFERALDESKTFDEFKAAINKSKEKTLCKAS